MRSGRCLLIEKICEAGAIVYDRFYFTDLKRSPTSAAGSANIFFGKIPIRTILNGTYLQTTFRFSFVAIEIKMASLEICYFSIFRFMAGVSKTSLLSITLVPVSCCFVIYPGTR